MRAKTEKSILPISIALVLGAIAAMLLAAGCSNDLPVASVLERTRVLGARGRGRRRSGPRRGDARRGSVGRLDRRRAERTRDARLGVRALHDGRRRLRGRAAADRRGQRDAGDGAFTTPDAATLGTNLLPLMLGVVCADGTIGVDPNSPLADLHRPGRERNARALHRAGHPRRRDAEPPPGARQRRHRDGRRGVGFRDGDGRGAGRRLRRDHRAAGRRPPRRRAATP